MPPLFPSFKSRLLCPSQHPVLRHIPAYYFHIAYTLYEEQGKGVVIMTSALDTRDGVGYVSSRIGIKRPAITIEETTDIFNYIRYLPEKPYCVLVDEA